MKNNILYIFVLLLFCCAVLAGCDRYLGIDPKGTQLLSTVADYDQWLNDDETLVYGVGQPTGTLNYLADNVDVVNITNPPIQPLELVYTWAPQFSTVNNVAPLYWGEHYAKINHFNTVLAGIDGAIGGSNSQKRSLKAEALLGRALEYFYLLNEYGKPHDPATADQDLAVPFVTSNDVTQVVPPRSTVAEVYRRLQDDLNAAILDLPDDNSANRFRGSRAAAHSLLARVHFYARNYEEARGHAEQALGLTRAVMIDFNGALPTSNLVSTRQDVIYGRMVAGQAPPTLEFMRSFAGNDLRVRRLYLNTDGYSFTVRGATIFFPSQITPVFYYVNTGTSVQEMKLIVAECAARSNELSIALQHLDEVRKNRFDSATYERYESDDQEAVLAEVLLERGHELPFSCLRWFDMRRLDQENRMDTVYRYDAQGNIIATLPPRSNQYTLQIPNQVLSFNPGMPQNP